MEESGVSKVITIKLEENGRIVLPDPEPFEEEDVAPETDVFIPPHPPKRKTGQNYAAGLIVEKAKIVEEAQSSEIDNLQGSLITEDNEEISTENEEENEGKNSEAAE